MFKFSLSKKSKKSWKKVCVLLRTRVRVKRVARWHYQVNNSCPPRFLVIARLLARLRTTRHRQCGNVYASCTGRTTKFNEPTFRPVMSSALNSVTFHKFADQICHTKYSKFRSKELLMVDASNRIIDLNFCFS